MKMTRQSELFVKALADGMGQVKGLMRHISIAHFSFSLLLEVFGSANAYFD